MNTRLGISIYPEKVGKNATIEYIKLASKFGFKRIFANLLELKNDQSGQSTLKMLASVYKFGQDLKMEVIVDVNPNFYNEFKLKPDEINFFRKLNVNGIRLDEDFKGVVEAKLSRNEFNFKIELNASSSTKIIDDTLANNGNVKNIIACHNFYPMRYTGLDKERFIQLSSYYNAKNIRVAAFVTLLQEQKGVGPWDVNEGMPTLEEDRYRAIDEQVNHLLQLNVVNDIIISQQGATEEQFEKIANALNNYEKIKSSIITLGVKFLKNVGVIEKDIALVNKNKNHTNRPDYNSYFIRSTYPRIDYKNCDIKPNNIGKKLKIGDVIVLNNRIGRYKGELHIIVKPIDDSKSCTRNLIGRISKIDFNKLIFIKGGVNFKLKEIE